MHSRGVLLLTILICSHSSTASAAPSTLPWAVPAGFAVAAAPSPEAMAPGTALVGRTHSRSKVAPSIPLAAPHQPSRPPSKHGPPKRPEAARHGDSSGSSSVAAAAPVSPPTGTVLYNWIDAGWCLGVIEMAKAPKTKKIGRPRKIDVDLRYAGDADLYRAALEHNKYLPNGPADSWVLLEARVALSSPTAPTLILTLTH